MNDRQFLLSMVVIHVNELLKYMDSLDSMYRMRDRSHARMQFEQLHSRLKIFRGIVTPDSDLDRELIDGVGSCYSDLGRKVLDKHLEDRNRAMASICEFLDSL